MIQELNQKFNSLGVFIEKIDIMNVIIPRDLRISLSETTNFDVLLQNQVKYQENIRLKLNNEENMMLL